MNDLVPIPSILYGSDFKQFIQNCHQVKGRIICGIGGHIIKTGLSPIFIQLIKDGWIHHIAANGAVLIHDIEIAMHGKTSEDVDKNLFHSYGKTKETIEVLLRVIDDSYHGSGNFEHGIRSVINEFPYQDKSILLNAVLNNVSISIHVAIGTDILHMHSINGAKLGKVAHQDFLLFASRMKQVIDRGAYINFGSAVILPEVFLKAITLIGKPPTNFITANFDMINHYRTRVNVVNRIKALPSCNGYNFIGYHELLIPLFYYFLTRKS